MLQAQASEGELTDQFLAAIRSLPEVQAELERAAAPGHDAQAALDVAGKPIHALVEVRKAVYPRDVHERVWRIALLDAWVKQLGSTRLPALPRYFVPARLPVVPAHAGTPAT